MRCRRSGPEGLDDAVDEALARLEESAGKRLADSGGPAAGLRAQRRARLDAGNDGHGLNLGLNDRSVAGLAARTGNERLAWDSYRRLVQMFGDVVCGVPGAQLRG
jgi:pyruvate,orthophosphate dikinase